uniref:Uncharacterized protein n=1 Tax=Acanthochromis polyacanthus TaxID=80966 RepID=A0A3Q1F2B1_9TELE
MCVFRQWLWVKAFSQMVHLYGLSPLCVLMWTVKYVLRAHAFPQIPHTNGLMPEWIATWLSRLVLRLKDQPQSGQRGPLVVKPRPHSPQWYGFSLVWVLMWIYSERSPQTPQTRSSS